MPNPPAQFSRLNLLIGEDNLARLSKASVLVCGLGGVGSWAAEGLARSGVGHICLVDFDIVKESNINRQMPALNSTLGQKKTDVMAARLKDINPNAQIDVLDTRLTRENLYEILTRYKWDCVIDAIDERQPKLALLKSCVENGIFVISSMGAGNKIDAGAIAVEDLFATAGCPMAKLLRKALKKDGIFSGITAVYSKELPVEHESQSIQEDVAPGEKQPLGSIVYITAIFGMRCAAVAINHIIDAKSIMHRGECR